MPPVNGPLMALCLIVAGLIVAAVEVRRRWQLHPLIFGAVLAELVLLLVVHRHGRRHGRH